MPWMKVDDGLHATRKVVRIPRRRRMAAMGLWIIAASWSAANLTDGCLDEHEVDELGGTSEQAQWLVDAGLWERTESGYRFHDWADYQPTRAEVLAKRKDEAERKRIARSRPRGQRADSDRTDDGRRADTDGTPPGQQAESEHPDPTRPDPTPSPNGEKTPPRKRGTRLDASWQPSSELIAQMQSECPAVDLRAEHLVFVDYWIGVSGQRGVKADWDGTWRNWMRRKRDDTASRDKPRATAAQRNLTVVERFAAREQEQYPSALEGM
ncbi:hypothetical protein DEI99_005165 [Curtobacterium sp. MCLR17_036]|uniref:hypothetical protein n=1 Tax=Curtobacterium sp. MCLR17_036 TaxID=2175620 RepID=UPI000DA73C82|nr:hypothetical protein [Curtobacterium sp. MCLR17_036]WIE65929.1 hypothetical protein DEI99_005165 [Curtobacterium sp. MCLR17_036]